MRLIDADALMKEFEIRQKRRINEYCDCFLNDAQNLSTEWYCVEDIVEAAPTIEAEPVRHAKILYNVAIEKEECNGYKKRKGLVLQKYTCSSCYTAIDGDSKFCKECGAKMDLEG